MTGVKRWRWWSIVMLAAFCCGVGAGGYLDWYFTVGPGAASMDAGEAHGFWLMLIGFPTSWMIAPFASGFPDVLVRALMVLSVGVAWALPWTVFPILKRLG
ncbi:MAG TPA: hypothetical protein VFT45_28270 [Longimicrobium sp.]|nr:hypothetical protein [Longimicrobium sp.]